MGQILGALIGMVFVGGAMGWAIEKALKKGWPVSDSAGLLIVALLGGFVNGSTPGNSIPAMMTMYLIAAIPAFFILKKLRDRKPQPPTA